MDNTSSPSAEKVVQDISRQTEIPVTPKKSFYKSPVLLGLLLLILVIAAFFAGGKFLGAKNNQTEKVAETTQVVVPSTTLDTTANWQAYQGKTFSFKYPSGWKEPTEKGAGGVERILETDDLVFTDYSSVQQGALISVPANPASLTGEASLGAVLITLENPLDMLIKEDKPLEVLSLDEYLINDQPAKKRIIKRRDAYEIQIVYTYPKVTNNIKYSFISLLTSKESLEKYNKVFDQILKTFSFTDEAQVQYGSNSELDRLAKEAMMSYLAGFKATSVADDQRISDYSIDSIAKIHVKNQELRFLVTYSVKPVGNIETSFYWMAGSGGKVEGGWIKKEEGYVIAPLQNGKYVIQGIATGVGKDF